MIKTISIGLSTYEMHVQVEDSVKEGSITRFINKVGCGGGDAANVAYLLGKWGVSSTFAGTIGNDVFGNRIQKELQSVGVDTRYIETTYDKDTPIAFVVTNEKTKNGTSYIVSDDFVKLRKFDFDFQPDLIYTDGNDSYASKSTIERFPKAISICGATRNTQDVLDTAKLCQYVICNREFAESLTKQQIDFNNTQTLVNVYDALRKKLSHQNIVITLGDHGALYQINDQIKVSPALLVKTVTTIGTADVFHGGFTYAIASGLNIEQAVKYANITAGLATQIMGTRLSIPKIDEVKKIYEKNS